MVVLGLIGFHGDLWRVRLTLVSGRRHVSLPSHLMSDPLSDENRSSMRFFVQVPTQESLMSVLRQNSVSATFRIQPVRQRAYLELWSYLYTKSDIPISILLSDPQAHLKTQEDEAKDNAAGTYIVCRLGNDSQLAVEALRERGVTGVLKDLVGGLRAWSKEVDPTFPVY